MKIKELYIFPSLIMERGFDPLVKRNGIGISNIINRIESYNGEVILESSPGNGCKLEIRIPY
jgi:signal transduction histidine kinase